MQNVERSLNNSGHVKESKGKRTTRCCPRDCPRWVLARMTRLSRRIPLLQVGALSSPREYHRHLVGTVEGSSVLHGVENDGSLANIASGAICACLNLFLHSASFLYC